MKILSVTGGAALSGSVAIHGAKNSVLPILAASILSSAPCVLHNCPQIEDVEVSLAILRHLGCDVNRDRDTLFLDAQTICRTDIPPELAGKMRSSILFLGALAARMGEASLALPGGCPLGARPIDLHLSALAEMGSEISVEQQRVICKAKKLHPAHICLPFPSVGATENILLAASRCNGTLVLENAAMEPEIADLIAFLRKTGVQISGAGSKTLTIASGNHEHAVRHTVIPDRIETATYLCAVAGCGGNVQLRHTSGKLLLPVMETLRAAGCHISEHRDGLHIRSDGRLSAPPPVCTMPYPGFPTDAQAPVMAALLRAEGICRFRETIFEDRFHHISEFRKMGADVSLDNTQATLHGVAKLHGANMYAADLRCGAALVIAALQAEGKSCISGVKHLERGYDKLEENLKSLGAEIKTVEIS